MPSAMTYNVEPLEIDDPSIKCEHFDCDGRRAYWLVFSPKLQRYRRSCQVHVGHFVAMMFHELGRITLPSKKLRKRAKHRPRHEDRAAA